MKPIWKINTGRFAGWVDERSNRLYDAVGKNIGYTDGTKVYSLNGHYIGEIVNGEFIGKRVGKSFRKNKPVRPSTTRKMKPPEDRDGMPSKGWVQPKI